jgi:hypothetical protein
LLGIAADETDPEVIEEAALRQTSHVRLYQTGPQSAECTTILNEIGQARATLLNAEKRRQYDAGLRKPDRQAIPSKVDVPSGSTPPPPVFAAGRSRARSAGSVVLPAIAYGALLLFSAGLAFGVGLRRTRPPAPPPRAVEPPETSAPEEKVPAPKREVHEILEGHEAAVRALAAGSDGSSLFSAGGDYVAGTEGEPIGCVLRQWEPLKGRLVRVLGGPRSPVHCLALSRSEELLLAGSGGYRWRDGVLEADDCVVRLWDVKEGVEKLTFTGHEAPVRGVAFSATGKRAVSCSSDGDILLWDVTDPSLFRSLAAKISPLECLALSPKARHLVVGGGDGQLRLWDFPNAKELPERFRTGRQPVHAVTFSPGGNLLASAGGRMVDRDGKVVHDGCVIRIWNVETGKPRDELTGHTRPIRALAWGRDDRIVSGSLDGTVRVWDGKKGQELLRLEAGAGVTCVALLPKGRRLLAGTLTGQIRVWDLDQELARRGGKP